MAKNTAEDKVIYMPKQAKPKIRPSGEKVEIDREEIINTLKTIESLKRKWLSHLK